MYGSTYDIREQGGKKPPKFTYNVKIASLYKDIYIRIRTKI